MKRSPLVAGVRVGLLLLVAGGLASCGQSANRTNPTAQGNLDDAIQARTEVVALQQEVAANVLGQLRGETEAAKAMQAMRKVIAKAESKQEEGNILLTKDRYADAATSYTEAAKLYRQALDWRKIQKDLAQAERGAATARLLAEAAGQFQAAKAKAADAQAKASAALFAEATTALKDAIAGAKTKENAAKAVPVLARFDTALATANKFAVSQVLAELLSVRRS